MNDCTLPPSPAIETYNSHVLCSVCRRRPGGPYLTDRDFDEIRILIAVKDSKPLRAWCSKCGIAYDVKWLVNNSRVLNQVIRRDLMDENG